MTSPVPPVPNFPGRQTCPFTPRLSTPTSRAGSEARRGLDGQGVQQGVPVDIQAQGQRRDRRVVLLERVRGPHDGAAGQQRPRRRERARLGERHRRAGWLRAPPDALAPAHAHPAVAERPVVQHVFAPVVQDGQDAARPAALDLPVGLDQQLRSEEPDSGTEPSAASAAQSACRLGRGTPGSRGRRPSAEPAVRPPSRAASPPLRPSFKRRPASAVSRVAPLCSSRDCLRTAPCHTVAPGTARTTRSRATAPSSSAAERATNSASSVVPRRHPSSAARMAPACS